MERGDFTRSAVQDIQERYNIPVFSIVTIEEIINFIYYEMNNGR
jgi:orotate phosphoribosyltransferase